VTDIPREFLDAAKDEVMHFCIGITLMTQGKDENDLVLRGSGTLVDIGGNLGILTAQHVVEAIPENGEVGLVLSKQLHNFKVRTEAVTRVLIGKGDKEDEGPDLGFILLPHVVLGQVKALKSFYNIGKRRERILNEPVENDVGVWCISGFPDEYTRQEAPSQGFDEIKCFFGLCGFGGVSKFWDSGDFDYFDFDVYYNEKNEPPQSFGGVSGGGLWQVIIARDTHGNLLVGELVLSGVTFYQSFPVGRRCILRGHGTKSIYSQAYRAVERECS
jgi:hypothetical protein